MANLAKNLNKNDEFLGFRIVDIDFINQLLTAFKRPLAVTSANLSNQESNFDAEKIIEQFILVGNNDFLLVDGGLSHHKIASTVVKIDKNNVEILRKGAAEIEINDK